MNGARLSQPQRGPNAHALPLGFKRAVRFVAFCGWDSRAPFMGRIEIGAP